MMSDKKIQENEQKPIERDNKVTANEQAKPKRKRRNNKNKAKNANVSVPEVVVTSRNETAHEQQIDSSASRPTVAETDVNRSAPEIIAPAVETQEQTVSSEEQEQNPTEGNNNIVDTQTTKKMYSLAFMLELSRSPLSQIEPEYLKNFEEILVTNPDANNNSPTTSQETTTCHQIDSNPGPRDHNNDYQRRHHDENHFGFHQNNNRFNQYNARSTNQMNSNSGQQYNEHPRRYNENHGGVDQNNRFNPYNARAASQMDSNSGQQYNGHPRRNNDNHNDANQNNYFNPSIARSMIPFALSPETIQLRPCYGPNNNNRGYPQVNGHNNNAAHVNNYDAARYRRENGRNNSNYNNTNNYNKRNTRNVDNNSNGFQTNHAREQNTVGFNPCREKKVIHFSLAKSGIVELNTSKNAWVPSCKKEQKSTDTSAEVSIEEIQKKVRSILNKITPENMVELTKTIIELPITTYDCLVKIIELLFQKAIDEPNFTPQYAYISSEMKHIEVMQSDDCTTKKSFQRLIIEKCQDTFEAVSTQEKDEADRMSEIESCKDQDLKKELQSKYDENERIQRKRSVGNCRFMCELFKVNLLKARVIDMCVSHLLKMPKEEPLECLCNILKHIGSRLNPEKTFFGKLQELTSVNYRPKIPSRIRFMILDTIELKNNNWVPRNSVIKPKTLKEIENEFTGASSVNSQPVVFRSDAQPETRVNTCTTNVQRINARPMASSVSANAKKLIENEFSWASLDNEKIFDFIAKPEARVNVTTDVERINARPFAVEAKIKKVNNAQSPEAQTVQKPSKIPNSRLRDSREIIQNVVNSLTANNLVSSSEELIAHISSVDRIEEMLDVIFKTAISEPEKISLLVETCWSLKGIVLQRTADGKGSVHVSFKKQLAVRCRQTLQLQTSLERDSKCSNTTEKSSYTIIGELFNKKLVPLNLMVEFINDVTTDRSSDAFIEVLCHLLKIIGPEIERPYSLKSTMKRLATIAEGSISPQCKDAIKDLIQLHSNKWIPGDSLVEKPMKNTKRNKGRSGVKNSAKK